jgi:hypothetical protein
MWSHVTLCFGKISPVPAVALEFLLHAGPERKCSSGELKEAAFKRPTLDKCLHSVLQRNSRLLKHFSHSAALHKILTCDCYNLDAMVRI